MKRHSRITLLVLLGACLSLSFSGPGLADEPEQSPETPGPDTSTWVCRLCPAPGGWLGEFSLGLILVDDPTPKFADYRGLDEDDDYVAADGDVSYRNDSGYYLDFRGRDLGLESRSLDLRGGKQGRFEFRTHYSEIPRYQGHGTVTPYLGVGTDTLTLPADWRSNSSSANEPLFTPAPLESRREVQGGGFTVKMGSRWKYQADFERQTRDGTRTFSGGLFAISAALFPAPIDYTTDLFNTGLEYTGKRGFFRLQFVSSDFDNGNDSVTYDSPYALGFGDDLAQNALEPDNEYHQFSLAGAVRIASWLRLSGKASMGSAEQNEAFLPYSTNPRYDDLELPRNSLDGELETSMFNLSTRLHARLADGLDLTAQYKVNERDNKTPIDVYTPILLEAFRLDPRSNRPYSYERTQANVQLRYRLSYKFRLNAGWKQDELERTYQQVEETEEDSYWGEMQFSPWAWADVRLKFSQQDRGAMPFMQVGNHGHVENPLMRQFNMAGRERDKVTFELDLSPFDRLGINLSYYATDDVYLGSVLGLTASEEQSLNLDLNFVINDAWNLYAFMTQDEIESDMAAAEESGASPWMSFSEDSILTWGLGVSGQVNDKFSVGFDYVFSDSEAEILTDTGAGEAPFPVLETELKNTRLYMNYQINERWALGVDAYQEEYNSSDWMVDGIGPEDIQNILTMGETSPDYDVDVFRLYATLRF